MMDLGPTDHAIERAFDPALTNAGYVRAGSNWVWEQAGALAAFTAVGTSEAGRIAYSLRLGWRYDAFGDPMPEPRTAHGCVRGMKLDELAGFVGKPLGIVGDLTSEAVLVFEQQLTTVVRKHVLAWVETWKRPSGFRDFLAAQGYHLGAAWASALLGQDERSRLELVHARHLYQLPLDSDFDRQRADMDESLAAVFAANHGLAGYLAGADESVVGAFTSRRGDSQRDRVTDPAAEHRRMQTRHAAYAQVCVRSLG